MPLSQDYVGAPHGALESSVQEAIASLTYDLVDSWPSVGLEEEEGTGTILPAEVSSAVLGWEGQPQAYLPQEEWVFASPTRPAPPQSEGSGSDYCALA